MKKAMWFLLFGLMFGYLLASCRDLQKEDLDSLTPEFVTRTHLPGTLLEDGRGRYWMVMNWPDRSLVLADEMTRARLDPARAIRMSPLEELCLRNNGLNWRGRGSWSLVRLPDGAYWYVDRLQKYRRAARLTVMQAWRDDPARAEAWSEPMSRWESDYRNLGPMALPEGALVRTETRLFYFFNGEIHPFASERLAREAGYSLRDAVTIPDADISSYAEVASPLTVEIFATCPWAVANARRDDDEDGDGSPRLLDCDDRNPNRAPFLSENCDGVDNDCDGVADNGYAVGLPCTLDDGCYSPGVTTCAFDRLSVTCDNQEAICDQ